MITIRFPGYIELLIRGKKVKEMLSQELVDLARELARHPDRAKDVDIRTLKMKDPASKL